MRPHAVLAFAVAMGCAGAASAAVIDPVNVLQHVNALIYNNATTSADIQGEAIIGGNFSGATMDNNFTPLTGYGALTVYGSTTGSNLNLGNGGSAYVGGTRGEKINFNGKGGEYLTTAPPNTINDFETAMNGFSTSLSQLAATSTLPSTGNNEVLVAHPNSAGVAIFDITAAQLDLIPSYSIDLNGAKTVLFNVSGSAVDFKGNESNVLASAGDVIWNFYQATSVDLETQIGGQILATQAAVINSNQIDGSLVAKSWTGKGELHSNLFTGVSPMAVPEPGTWALMMIGIGAVGASLRLRRGKTSATQEAA